MTEVAPGKVWLRTKVDPGTPGRRVTDDDVDMLVRGRVNVYKPDGSLLLAFRPRAVPQEVALAARTAFEPLVNSKTENRGIAAGLPEDGSATTTKKMRVTAKGYVSNTNLTRVGPVRSSVVGYFDRYPRTPFCRQTSFVANHPLLYNDGVVPYCQEIASVYAEAVPDRYAVQMKRAQETHLAWVIPGTPYTTLTVNFDFTTAMHTDKGDLPDGFSMISAVRRGSYSGCLLVFPAFRVACDLHTGDVVLFDSHEMHGNTQMVKHSDDAERCTTVFYYRTKMAECGSPAEERERAAQQRGGFAEDE